MEWISVNDRLPEKSGTYLICTPYRGVFTSMDVMMFSKRYGKFNAYDGDDGDEFSVDSVTHWMPLPDPPALRREERR